MKKLFTISVVLFVFFTNAQSVSISSSATGAVCAGTSVTFTATTSGITSPTYQWYKSGTALSGATTATYTTTSLSNNDQISVQATPGYTAGSISTTGLIAHFDAANYNSSSTRWTDQSSSANHMDFYSSTGYSTLKTATYSTDGGGSLISAHNSASSIYGKTVNSSAISGNQGKTISAWVKFTDLLNGNTIIAGIGDPSISCYQLYPSQSGSGWILYNNLNGSLVLGHSVLALNTWYHVTITSDGSSNNYIYINGIQEGTNSQTLSTTNTPLYLGQTPGGFVNFGGKISTLSLYNSGLSAQNVLDNYNATKGRYTTTSVASNTITASITAGPSATLTVSGDACINKTTLSTTIGLTSYTWYKDNVALSGATTNTFVPTVAGDYKVAVSNGTCTTISSTTPIYSCGVTADGKMVSITTPGSLLSLEGGANFGTGIDNLGKIINTTDLTTTTGTIGATTAVLGGVISATNAVTSSIGVIYSTDANFSTSSSSTIQSNVVAGTYTSSITGLSSSTTYYAKSFVVNNAGTSYGPVVSFTTTTPPITVGSTYGGGFVFYIFQSTDAGYVSGETHGYISETRDQTTNDPSNPNSVNTNWSTWNNAQSLINDPNNHSTAGKLYSDWRFPSSYELNLLYTQLYTQSTLATFRTFTANFYWSSSTASGNSALGCTQTFAGGARYCDQGINNTKLPVRSIRSF